MNVESAMKNIGVDYDTTSDNYSPEVEAQIRDFMEDHGINEVKRINGLKYKIIEYDAMEMNVTWTKLQAGLEDLIPFADVHYSESTGDGQDNEFQLNESLEISI